MIARWSQSLSAEERRRRQAGLTYIELVVCAVVLSVLALAIVPTARWVHKRRKEERLRAQLVQMRRAIDIFRDLALDGRIEMEELEQEGWPLTLESLVEGVEVLDPDTGEKVEMRFLPRLPVDPFTETEEWGMRSYQDDFDARSWGGENVYDVYSLATGVALDGTYYADW